MTKSDNSPASILVVDDQPQVRGVLCELLGQDYKCVEAASAEESLELLRVEQFDLILTDIVMGGMSGLEMIAHARQLAPETVVIMISAEQTITNAIEAMRAGAFDYITKPFDLRQVLMAVRRALDYRALREAKRRYEADLEELVRRRTAELDHVSLHDTVTGLYNRAFFEDYLGRALAQSHGGGPRHALIFFDLERFKQVNDTLGYRAGDRLLQLVAERLSAPAREDDVVARIGGDKFARFVPLVNGPEDAAEIARHIHEALASPFEVGEQELFVTASIGISLYPGDGQDFQTLLKNATAALYRARQQGGGGYQFYTADMNDMAARRLTLEHRLRRAVERGELSVYYQPKIDIESECVVGMEALVRWQSPELGSVSPAEFIPLAEDSGLIISIGEWVLRTACAQNKLWQDGGFARLRVAVNLSARQFREPNLSAKICQILGETGLDSQYLELELTESSIMERADSAVKALGELREMGVEISVDDFGTGYSSLGYLKRLPVGTLKIDQSFVREVTTGRDSAAIVQAIIALAHNLGMKVVAEGVETEDQLRFLRLLRCDHAQGYLFSKPLPAEEFERKFPGSILHSVSPVPL
jgi:diguanylate cyclase (GGDEF)-like protein